MKLPPVHTVSSGHDPSSPDQGSSTGVVEAAARFVLKRDLMEQQQRALQLQETEPFQLAALKYANTGIKSTVLNAAVELSGCLYAEYINLFLNLKGFNKCGIHGCRAVVDSNKIYLLKYRP